MIETHENAGDLRPHQYPRVGPICGARTGLAIPKKTVTPWPPQRVESASLERQSSCRCPASCSSPRRRQRGERDVGLHLQASSYVAAGRRNLVARLEARRAILRARTAELHDRTVRHGEVGDPNVVVAIHGRSPRPR